MDKLQAKKLFRIIIILYISSFLIINWSDVSWVFNYTVVSNLVEDFFNPYPSIDARTMNAYFYPNRSNNANIATTHNNMETPTATVNTQATHTDKQNTIEIPKINIEAPIIFSQSTDKNSLMKDLDKGVIYYPGSVYPGEMGQIIILGHSAPPGWPKTKYEWVFSDLNNLVIGDKVLIDLNNRQYTYIVKQKNIIARGAEVPVYNSATNTSVLTLISCWPPGKDYQRIAVQAELSSE